jgi:hypothetical protein
MELSGQPTAINVDKTDNPQPTISVLNGSNRKQAPPPCTPMLRSTYSKTGPLEFAQHIKARYPSVVSAKRFLFNPLNPVPCYK